MNDALHQLNRAERTFAEAQSLPEHALERLHSLRQQQQFPTLWHQIGVWIVAPILAGFAEWMAGFSPSCQRPLYLGVMREGRLLAQAMAKLYGTPAQDIWLNRNLAMLAAFGCGDREALLNWLVRTRLQPTSRAEAEFELLGKKNVAADAQIPLDIPAVQDLLDQWTRSGELAEIQRRASDLAERLVAHWQKTCASIAAPDMIFLMDFASAGNIQRSLQTIFAAKGLTVPLMGLNFCMTEGSRWAEAAGCAMKGYLAEGGAPEWFASAYARTPELIEIFMAEPAGSLQDYDKDGTPLCNDGFLSSQQRLLMLDVQKHILDAATMYHHSLGKSLTADIARCLWGRLLLAPLPAEIEAMANWPLDAGLDGRPRRVLAAHVPHHPEPWTKMQTAWPAASRHLSSQRQKTG